MLALNKKKKKSLNFDEQLLKIGFKTLTSGKKVGNHLFQPAKSFAK